MIIASSNYWSGAKQESLPSSKRLQYWSVQASLIPKYVAKNYCCLFQ